jgi:hypothetical protein
MPRPDKKPQAKRGHAGQLILNAGDGTITGDLEAAANRLDEAAQIDKNSYTCRGRFIDPAEGNEYKEKRRLARRLRTISRVFSKS